jgi:hypothetical protein
LPVVTAAATTERWCIELPATVFGRPPPPPLLPPPPLPLPLPADSLTQGLTLVHFSAQLERD